jgi:Paf1
MLTLD